MACQHGTAERIFTLQLHITPTWRYRLPDPCAHEWLACPLGGNQGVSNHGHENLGLLLSVEALGQTELLDNQGTAAAPHDEQPVSDLLSMPC